MVDPVTNEDVLNELNVIERLLSGGSSTDEYLQALNRNMRLLVMQNMGMVAGEGAGAFGGVDPDNLPVGLAGKALEAIPAGQHGAVVFNVSGSDLVTQLELQGGDASLNEVVQVIDTDNVATPVTNLNETDLNIGSSVGAANVTDFEVYESEDPVTVEPGETENVLTASFDDTTRIFMVGTTDQTDSQYQYEIDGEELLNNPAEQPLGLYNDPFEFPLPLKAKDEWKTKVTRDAGAGANADYVGKIVTYK